MVNFESLKQTFKGKKVFVTGHTGFKGAWFVFILNMLGAKVKAYALQAEEKSLYNILENDEICASIIGDIRDKDRIRKEIIRYEPDFVFHLAAQALVLDSYIDPVNTYETNVMGTIYVLDALRHLEKKCVTVIITTDKVYENLEKDYAYNESDRLGGFDPYSNSKACAELAVSSYKNSFFPIDKIDAHKQYIATVRSGNVIGGGDWSDNRIIPDLVKSLSRNIPLSMRNPNAIRPWQHVLDPLNAYLQLANKMWHQGEKFADSYNFGPSDKDELTVKQLVEKAIEVWGSGTYVTPELKNKPHEAGLLKLDISKASKELNWKPILQSERAIEYTLNWYKNYKRNPLAYTIQQIQSFYNEIH